jgi:GH25 family lysozyme M1 (1,4-beta-N-acetylmuramidase)
MLLHLKPKSSILYAANGIDFCGYKHFADHKKVRKRAIRTIKGNIKAYEAGELSKEEFMRKYNSNMGHLGHADTYHIQKAVEYELLFYEWENMEKQIAV